MRALVTGGTHGIGLACAHALGFARGDFCEVLMLSRSSRPACDVTDPADRKRFMDANRPVDILINNVGGGGRYGTYEEIMAKNVTAMIEFTDWTLPHMFKRKWGRVITISSIHGREVGSRPMFMAAKAAQIAFMKGLARNKSFARAGITFNTVCPGNVYIEGKPKVDEEALPMGRMGKPEEVAKLVAFLCSEDAAWINGAAIVIDGGESHAL